MIKRLIRHFTVRLTMRKAIAVLLGSLIAGFGIALLRISLMGNDPYSAMNMAMSDGLSVGLGTYQLVLNLGLLLIQLIFGRKYIGFGTIINMCFLGYIVQYSGAFLDYALSSVEIVSLPVKLLLMTISLIIVAFGLSMYQTSDLGVAPYDYLSLGLAERTKKPYFLFRVITDVSCVTVILIAFICGLFPWSGSHIGIGTVACAVGLGPMVGIFMKMNKKWILR